MKWGWKLRCFALFIVLAVTYPFIFMLFVQLPEHLVNKSRTPLSLSEAATVLSEEYETLGIPDDVTVALFLVPENKCRTEWSADNLKEFKITIGNHIVSRYSIEHEMYHVSRALSGRDMDMFESLLGYVYVEEPLAVTYAVFGIRLDFWN